VKIAALNIGQLEGFLEVAHRLFVALRREKGFPLLYSVLLLVHPLEARREFFISSETK